MEKDLSDRKIAILATDGFEQSELLAPLAALRKAGATVHVIAPDPKGGVIQGMEHHEKGKQVRIDHALADACADDYDGLVLPGGVANPDTLRMQPQAMSFIRHFTGRHKPIAAICHGPWTLIEAGAVKGRKMTSWPSLKTDLTNAGASWVDAECVRDGEIVTSRKPDDLPAFCDAAVELFAEKRAA